MNPVQLEKFLRGAQRLPCRGDDAVFDARKNLVPGLGVSETSPPAPRPRCSMTAGGALTPWRRRTSSASRYVVGSGAHGPEAMWVGSSPVTSEMMSASTGALHAAASRPLELRKDVSHGVDVLNRRTRCEAVLSSSLSALPCRPLRREG